MTQRGCHSTRYCNSNWMCLVSWSWKFYRSLFEIQPRSGLFKRFFDAEQLKVNDDANKRDSLYWTEHRQFPLHCREKMTTTRKTAFMWFTIPKRTWILWTGKKTNSKFRMSFLATIIKTAMENFIIRGAIRCWD